jgi:hypothetical protein
MANLRLQNILNRSVEEICSEHECFRSEGFIRLMLQELFELNELDVDEAITDGGMDRGIDAIFEQENDDGSNILYVVQSKYFENPDKSLDESTINKAILAILNYILGNLPSTNLNARLKNRIDLYRERLSDGKIDMVSLVFVTNGQKLNPNLRRELEQFKEQQGGQIKYEVYAEDYLSYIFAPISAMPVKQISLKIIKDTGSGSKTFINLPDIDFVQGKVAKVDICALAEVVKENPNIFNSNVRAYQSIRNKVNDAIATTLRDEELSKTFIYLNNGVTLLCDSFEVKPGNEVIVIDNPSIINGCQTASTILEVYNEGKLQPNTSFVLVRIIKSKDEEMKRKVIISSNTQTAVKNRDLISEEPIQKQLEKEFETLGYYYERKRGLHRDKEQEKVIDLEKAAQYYLALYKRKPAEAKNKKSEIYKSYKELVFNNELTANKLLVGYILFDKINERIKDKKRTVNEFKRSIFANSILHLLSLFKEWSLTESGKFLSDLEDDLGEIDKIFSKTIDSILDRFEDVINIISKKDKDNFNPQYFFKSSDSLERILEVAETRAKKDIKPLELNFQNYNRQKDLRYYKPNEVSLGGEKYIKIAHWNDLFIKLMEKYDKLNLLKEGNLDFIESGGRTLLLSNPDDSEKKLRKKMKNGLWLLTNFSANYLCRFCFALASEMEINILIRLRPTRFREQKKYKKHKKKAKN